MSTAVIGATTHGAATSTRVTDPNTPPTQFGRQASPTLVAAGHDLARRAIGKALERVPLDDAERALIELADHRDDALHIAQDQLGYNSFDVPLAAQVDALGLVEGARYRLANQPGDRSLTHRLRSAVCPGK